MHNGEITHIVKTYSLSKTQLIARTNILMSFENLCQTIFLGTQNAKARFETLKIQNL